MASKVAIANFALAVELGVDQITALTDDSPTARLVNLVFDDTAREVMAEGEWSSATFRQVLARDAAAPAWGFAYRYILPTDPEFLGLLKTDELVAGDIPYSVENGFLLTDEIAISLKYKGFQEDTEAYDMQLQRAITLKLAAKMCYNLTGNEKLKLTLLQEYQLALDVGLATVGLNSSDDDITVTNDLKDVRR